MRLYPIMKHLLTISAFIIILFSCNSPTKNISQTENTKQTLDTIITVKEPPLNITKDFVLGKFDYKNDPTFSKLKPPYASKDVYLKKQVKNAFLDLYNAAKADGIDLKIISATRNFEEQKVIWERKWKQHHSLQPIDRALKILEYSAMPSSSRHHWGTDIDLNSLNNSYFHSGKGLETYQWLKSNANTFGFYQVYTTKDLGRTGYNLEMWHWSYLPLASKYLDFYNKEISIEDIISFKGHEQAQDVMIIKDYVNGISKKAKAYK